MALDLSFKRCTVVIGGSCDSNEDVPKNTAFVEICSTIDVLAHVSVRTRNGHHGLNSCHDGDNWLRNLTSCQ